ncbi:glycosyltransferase family 4 protein [Candidatus Saccharibacteria bacterium TM7i]|nr:glycosyltransferase family 4 protein [Candidatus Saccharibacteria bacterium TM7i]
MRKTKLFFDGTPLIGKHVSGVGKVLQETLLALDTKVYADRYSIFIFLPFDERHNASHLAYTYIKVKYLPYPHKILSLFSRMRVAPPLDLFLGKGVYVFENFRNWSLIASKSITYVHDVAFKMHPEFIEERNLAYLNKYINMWVERSDVIVTVSEASRVDIEKVFGVKAEVIPNAVRGDLFRPRSVDEVNMVRNQWGIPERYYLFIGNIEPRKNLENTIDAYTQIAQPGEALVLIGGGGWRNESILDKAQHATLDGKIVMRPSGYVPDEDLPALISGAKALVHFPWYEGSGLPILQAASCGVPIAASDIPPLREVVSGFSDRVVFASPEDISLMAEAIKAASEKQHDQNIKTPVTWASAAQKLTDIVETL